MNAEWRGIEIRSPVKEVGRKVYKGGQKSDDHHSDSRQRPPTRQGNFRPKKGRTKTPAGTRFVALPPGIAVLYEELMDSHRDPFVLSTPEGHPWRRSNLRIRFWRPAWDGVGDGESDPGRPGGALAAVAGVAVIRASGRSWCRGSRTCGPGGGWNPVRGPSPFRRHLTTEALPLRGGAGLLTCSFRWCAILGLNQ
jgi:hypothetical protein